MQLKPHTQAFLDMLGHASYKPIQELTTAEWREGLAKSIEAFGALLKPIHKVEDWTITGESGHTIPVRLYTPSDEVKGLWVYAHGGGWMKGSIETYDTHLREMSHYLGVAILSVEYRLSPEHPFPQGHHDVLDAYVWARQHTSYKHYWLGGDSAGGNLTAGVICRLIEDRLPLPDAYIGIYPPTDLRLRHDAYKRFGQGYLLTTESVRLYVDCYLDQQRSHAYNFLASPLLYPHLDQFPQTILVTVSHDPLYDEQIEFADKLQKEGVDISMKVVEGVIHPFMLFGKIFPETYEVIDWLKNQLH